MSLIDLPSITRAGPLPSEVRAFLREADRRIERFCRETPVPAFVPGDFVHAYAVLRSLEQSAFLQGTSFCEWGSGFGVTACLAAMLGYESHGIEIVGDLVDESRRLASDFGLTVQFAQGSFIPEGAYQFTEAAEECAWLTGTVGGGYEALGLDPDDFDLIYAYPWPDEENLTAELFEQYGRDSALLVTDHEMGGIRVRRRRERRKKRK